MIDVQRLCKRYGAVQAVSDLSFQVDVGSVVGFLGPNGAGKSTTLRILAGFLGASSGQVRISGHDIVSERIQALSCLGYMPETSPLYPELRVNEYLAFRAELKGLNRRRRRVEIDRVADEAGISEMSNVAIGHLSKGYRQRVGLADALLGAPPLLILDEPSAGLDPNQIREVRALVRRLADRHTVLLSSHILTEVEAVCSRVLVIADGALLANGSIDEIRSQQSSPGVEITISGEVERARHCLQELDGVASTHAAEEGRQSILVDFAERGPVAGEISESLVATLVAEGFGVREVKPRGASLEQVFSQLTQGDSTEPTMGSEPSEPNERREPSDDGESDL